MDVHVLRGQPCGLFHLPQGVVPAAGVGIKDAKIEMSQFPPRVDAQSIFEQRQRGFRMVQLHLRVCQVDHGLDVIRIVGKLGMKLARRLRVLPLGPQQVAQTEVYVGLLRIGLHRGAELLDRAAVILQLILRLAGQHIGLRRLRVQHQNLVIRIQNAPILFGP